MNTQNKQCTNIHKAPWTLIDTFKRKKHIHKKDRAWHKLRTALKVTINEIKHQDGGSSSTGVISGIEKTNLTNLFLNK